MKKEVRVLGNTKIARMQGKGVQIRKDILLKLRLIRNKSKTQINL